MWYRTKRVSFREWLASVAVLVALTSGFAVFGGGVVALVRGQDAGEWAAWGVVVLGAIWLVNNVVVEPLLRLAGVSFTRLAGRAARWLRPVR